MFYKIHSDIVSDSLTEWSEFLITNHEVAGSIPGTFTILKVDYIWNVIHLNSWRKLASHLIEK